MTPTSPIRHLSRTGSVHAGRLEPARPVGFRVVGRTGFALDGGLGAQPPWPCRSVRARSSVCGCPQLVGPAQHAGRAEQPAAGAGRCCGLLDLARAHAGAAHNAHALRVFFAGLILSGLGSATYHWAPDAGSLVIDRLGMAVAFAGVLALAVAERVGPRASRMLPARGAAGGAGVGGLAAAAGQCAALGRGAVRWHGLWWCGLAMRSPSPRCAWRVVGRFDRAVCPGQSVRVG